MVNCVTALSAAGIGAGDAVQRQVFVQRPVAYDHARRVRGGVAANSLQRLSRVDHLVDFGVGVIQSLQFRVGFDVLLQRLLLGLGGDEPSRLVDLAQIDVERRPTSRTAAFAPSVPK
jgi:hypothetical protein